MEKWPADKVERWSVERLIPYARNARVHSEAQVAQIAASIREWGWTVPVLVDEDGMLIAGHGRVLAARQLDLASVPVMVASGWSDAQKRSYIIADNKLALNAAWDAKLLKVEMADLQTLGADLQLLGFDEEELAELFADDLMGLTDPDDLPEPLSPSVTALGDVWLLGAHRLSCGDSTNATAVRHALGGRVPHLMVTDPPYGVAYDPTWRSKAGINRNAGKMGAVRNDDRSDWREAWALFPGTVAYVWHAGLFAPVVADSLIACGFELRSQIIWAKSRFALSRGHYHWQHEPCWYVVRKADGASAWEGDRSQTTLWQIQEREDRGFGHGTQKPVACMRRPIENSSVKGHAVYDPFVGTGTTIIAAEMTDRRCFAMELEPIYVDMAICRWQDFTGQQARLESGGGSFTEVAEQRGVSSEPDGPTRQKA